ncbi:MAG: hypothetical protein JNK85_06295 [Verrucomicrobiales bacterium]|nr:hypothetical protein [Verrucomicrobiales bacterium]
MPSTTSLAHLSLTPRDYDFVTGILAAGARPRESVEAMFQLTQRRWMTVPTESVNGDSAMDRGQRQTDGVVKHN